jgi:hypothetical protein
VEVELPAAEVGRQPLDVTLEREVVGDPKDVSGAVDKERKHQDGDHEKSDWPAED